MATETKPVTSIFLIQSGEQNLSKFTSQTAIQNNHETM